MATTALCFRDLVLFGLAWSFGTASVHAAVLADPPPPVQHPALVAEWLAADPQVHDLGYFHLRTEPCLLPGPHPLYINELQSISRPLTASDETIIVSYQQPPLPTTRKSESGEIRLCAYPF